MIFSLGADETRFASDFADWVEDDCRDESRVGWHELEDWEFGEGEDDDELQHCSQSDHHEVQEPWQQPLLQLLFIVQAIEGLEPEFVGVWGFPGSGFIFLRED